MADIIVNHATDYSTNPNFAGTGITSINTGITTNNNNFLYSPDFSTCTGSAYDNVKNFYGSTNIQMSGEREFDYQIAETSGFAHVPGVTVWHHRFITNAYNGWCTMQLVGFTLHQKTCPHAGACYQYTQYTGNPYKATQNGKLLLNAECKDFTNTKRELAEWEYMTGMHIPKKLWALYTGTCSWEKGKEFKNPHGTIFIDFIFDLKRQNGENTANVNLLTQIWRQPNTCCSQESFPVGTDPYGNILFSDKDGHLYFYDHEMDTKTDLEITLDELLIG